MPSFRSCALGAASVRQHWSSTATNVHFDVSLVYSRVPDCVHMFWCMEKHVESVCTSA